MYLQVNQIANLCLALANPNIFKKKIPLRKFSDVHLKVYRYLTFFVGIVFNKNKSSYVVLLLLFNKKFLIVIGFEN